MGTSVIRALAAVLGLVVAGCWLDPPCGWDGVIEVGTRYDVQLLERYSVDSTTAEYDPSLDLAPAAQSCGALDEVRGGGTIAVLPRGTVNCSLWFADIVEPPLDLGPRLLGLVNAATGNRILTSGRRDFGAGCEGAWELSVRSLSDDPFQPHTPGAIPRVVVYRVFAATRGSEEACVGLFGLEPPAGDTQLYCGDAFVASMSR